MYGIYINCKEYPFIDWIISGSKLYETRTKDTLSKLVGKRVFLIETGKHSVPVVRAVAKIAWSDRCSYSDVIARKQARIKDTKYDIKPGSEKVFYFLMSVHPVYNPFPVPASRVNHGRSYTEF